MPKKTGFLMTCLWVTIHYKALLHKNGAVCLLNYGQWLEPFDDFLVMVGGATVCLRTAQCKMAPILIFIKA